MTNFATDDTVWRAAEDAAWQAQEDARRRAAEDAAWQAQEDARRGATEQPSNESWSFEEASRAALADEQRAAAQRDAERQQEETRVRALLDQARNEYPSALDVLDDLRSRIPQTPDYPTIFRDDRSAEQIQEDQRRTDLYDEERRRAIMHGEPVPNSYFDAQFRRWNREQGELGRSVSGGPLGALGYNSTLDPNEAAARARAGAVLDTLGRAIGRIEQNRQNMETRVQDARNSNGGIYRNR